MIKLSYLSQFGYMGLSDLPYFSESQRYINYIEPELLARIPNCR